MRFVKQIFIIGAIGSLMACKVENRANLTFNELSGQAILLGENIAILDLNLDKFSTLEEGTLVSMLGISDSLFQTPDDYCNAFHYVKISVDNKELLVDGRNIYQLFDSYNTSGQYTSFNFQEKEFELKTTLFFGIGATDDDGLTFCSNYYEPIVLLEKTSNTTKLVHLVKNGISSEASWKDEFNYFVLMANDGALDSIENIEEISNGVILTIKREFQEGWNRYHVKLLLDKSEYHAEYMDYGEIHY